MTDHPRPPSHGPSAPRPRRPDGSGGPPPRPDRPPQRPARGGRPYAGAPDRPHRAYGSQPQRDVRRPAPRDRRARPSGPSFFAVTPHGLEDPLAAELRALGILGARIVPGGVGFSGSLEDAYRVCLWARTAERVLFELARFPADRSEQIYHGVRSVDWADHLTPRTSLACQAIGTTPTLRNSHYTALVVKDAVVDALRDRFGERPMVNVRKPDVRLQLLLRAGWAVLSLDLSGDALHRRGYRTPGRQTQAPLKETLAAGVLEIAGWPEMAHDGLFVDPLCGSGTLPLEAALMAADIAPGLLRSEWGFLRWKGHDAAAWQRAVGEAEERRAKGIAALTARARDLGLPPILGYDRDVRAVALARSAILRAGLSGAVAAEVQDVARLRSPFTAADDRAAGPVAGLVATNPPYGERLRSGDLDSLYEALGSTLRRAFGGWRAAVLLADDDRAAQLGAAGIRPAAQLRNGPIPCTLLRFAVGAEGMTADAGSSQEAAGHDAPCEDGDASLEAWPSGSSYAEEGEPTPFAPPDARTRPEEIVDPHTAAPPGEAATAAGSGETDTPSAEHPTAVPLAEQDAEGPAAERPTAVPLAEQDAEGPAAEAEAGSPDQGAAAEHVSTVAERPAPSASLFADAAGQFADRLRRNLRVIGRPLRRRGIDCYRVYDADLPDFNLAIDLYAGWVHVQEYQAPAEIDPAKAAARLQAALAVLPEVLDVPADHVVVKTRRRQRGSDQYERLAAEGDLIEVHEGPATYLVNLTDHIDTGLFLHQRLVRDLLTALADDRRFLNLFGYTGAATVAAALGGAPDSLTVDLSTAYLDWAQRNFRRNGLDPAAHRTVKADCLRWVHETAESDQRFGLILLGPPTFSNSAAMGRATLDIQRDHVELLRDTARLLSRDGVLLFVCAAHRFAFDSDQLQDLTPVDLSARTLPPDFARRHAGHQVWQLSAPAPGRRRDRRAGAGEPAARRPGAAIRATARDTGPRGTPVSGGAAGGARPYDAGPGRRRTGDDAPATARPAAGRGSRPAARQRHTPGPWLDEPPPGSGPWQSEEEPPRSGGRTRTSPRPGGSKKASPSRPGASKKASSSRPGGSQAGSARPGAGSRSGKPGPARGDDRRPGKAGAGRGRPGPDAPTGGAKRSGPAGPGGKQPSAPGGAGGAKWSGPSGAGGKKRSGPPAGGGTGSGRPGGGSQSGRPRPGGSGKPVKRRGPDTGGSSRKGASTR